MSLARRVLFVVVFWTAAVTLLHLWLNLRAFDPGARPKGRAEFRVGFLPVT
jgi:hypothetical protein